MALIIAKVHRHHFKLLSITLDELVEQRTSSSSVILVEQLCLDTAYDSTLVYKGLHQGGCLHFIWKSAYNFRSTYRLSYLIKTKEFLMIICS